MIVDKSLSLIGEDNQESIIDGSNNGTVVFIREKEVYFSNFTIQNSSHYHFGILISHFDNCNIQDNIIKENCFGLGLRFSSNLNKISDNEVFDNGYGITIIDSNKNLIKYNRVYDNTLGITAFNSSSNDFKINAINNNTYGIKIIKSSKNIVNDNIIYNNDINIKIDNSDSNEIKNNLVEKNRDKSIFINNSGYNLIKNNDFLNYFDTTSILVKNSRNVVIKENFFKEFKSEFSRKHSAVGVVKSKNIDILKNEISNFDIGILLFKSQNNRIFDNTLLFGYKAIVLYESLYNEVELNSLSNFNFSGTSLLYSNMNHIDNNSFVNITLSAYFYGEALNFWKNNYWAAAQGWETIFPFIFIPGFIELTDSVSLYFLNIDPSPANNPKNMGYPNIRNIIN